MAEINGGVPNYLLTGMILQVPGNSAGDLFGMVISRDPNSKLVGDQPNVWG